MMFDITVDKQLDVKPDFDIVAGVIRRYYPSLNCYNSEMIFNNDKKQDSDNNYTWFDIVSTPDDKTWTSAIDFHFFPDQISSSAFPQIQLTEQISKILNCNCICSSLTEIVSGLDEHDPYWTVAYVNQQWYFADTANMKLMGPYTDGINETVGDAELNLLYKLNLTNAKTNLYDYNVLKRNGS